MHVIDINALSKMFFGDKTKVQLVTDALIQRIPEWQQEVQSCSATMNHEDIRQLCHRIYGAAASIKAEKLAASATRLGDIIKAKQFDKTEACFAELNHCLEELLLFTIN
jgi:HPt (histidine-containing phosphotransfer) domain-containing protein